MVHASSIKKYVDEMVRRFHPEKVILFGSYAENRAHADSDVDLLFIIEHNNRRDVEQAISMRLEYDASFPLDLIVRTPETIKKRMAMNDMFISHILSHGRVLHG